VSALAMSRSPSIAKTRDGLDVVACHCAATRQQPSRALQFSPAVHCLQKPFRARRTQRVIEATGKRSSKGLALLRFDSDTTGTGMDTDACWTVRRAEADVWLRTQMLTKRMTCAGDPWRRCWRRCLVHSARLRGRGDNNAAGCCCNWPAAPAVAERPAKVIVQTYSRSFSR